MLTNLDPLDISAQAPVDVPAPPIIPFRRSTQDATRGKRISLKIRRLLDFTLALAMSLVALPIVVLAALAVKLTSRGPAFYTQVRTGRNGRTFTIYKLRSMV